jgi:hypothetical protein
MSKDILIRSLAALAVFGCLAYFAFGVAAVVASEQPGTAIHQYEPVTFALLWQETSKISPETVVAWSRRHENGRPGHSPCLHDRLSYGRSFQFSSAL